jgi:arylsulfatase A-like enzyme
VFVLVDDMRWDEMGVAGHPVLETPHMDRLAREGMRFENTFATTPLCSPSRASFLTGQYAHTNGIVDNTARPSHGLPTFPREIFKMGYSAVRTERHKYIEYRELQGMNELYDLQADPYEERNLIGTPAAASVEADLQRELQKLLTDTNAGS